MSRTDCCLRAHDKTSGEVLAIKNFAGDRDRGLEPQSLTCGGRPHRRFQTTCDYDQCRSDRRAQRSHRMSLMCCRIDGAQRGPGKPSLLVGQAASVGATDVVWQLSLRAPELSSWSRNPRACPGRDLPSFTPRVFAAVSVRRRSSAYRKAQDPAYHNATFSAGKLFDETHYTCRRTLPLCQHSQKRFARMPCNARTPAKMYQTPGVMIVPR